MSKNDVASSFGFERSIKGFLNLLKKSIL